MKSLPMGVCGVGRSQFTQSHLLGCVWNSDHVSEALADLPGREQMGHRESEAGARLAVRADRYFMIGPARDF